MVLLMLLLQLCYKPYEAKNDNTLDVTNMSFQLFHLTIAWCRLKGFMDSGTVDLILLSVFFTGVFVNCFFCFGSFFTADDVVVDNDEQDEEESKTEENTAAADDPKKVKADANRLNIEALEGRQQEWLDGALDRQRKALLDKNAREKRKQSLRRSSPNDEERKRQALAYRQLLKHRHSIV
eukprot:CAMPEP_0171612290 /NCGR_PEP_ID=MMETSP0990-20121206/11124_1 /TAXON_ID=483369 /ORGANISM="non described non described, Strain CCMP2098" /LENGTH=179 /DNA_ID=CAMNT_0012175997 /DNA_START=163 /DNA_END=702 /DNA_ORIENTATION=+